MFIHQFHLFYYTWNAESSFKFKLHLNGFTCTDVGYLFISIFLFVCTCIFVCIYEHMCLINQKELMLNRLNLLCGLSKYKKCPH